MISSLNKRSGTVPEYMILSVLGGVLLVIIIISLMTGRIFIPPWEVIKIIAARILPISHSSSMTFESVIIDVRLPRVLAGVFIGAGLSLSGAAFQGLFRNPLVSPHLLGVAAGSGFGAAIAILLSSNILLIQTSSFVFGVIAVAMAYFLSRTYKSMPVLMLVLSGIIVGSLFSALTSFVKYIADPMNKMPTIVFWLLGSLNNISNADLAAVAPVFILCSSVLLLIRWRINILAMGEEDARALGVNTQVLTAVIVICATFITAAAVCISGIIGWIGLVVPHIGRLLVGPDHKRLLPVSMLIGASFLVGVDMLARSMLAIEIPIGILTAIIGAPVFAWLLRRRQSGWNR